MLRASDDGNYRTKKRNANKGISKLNNAPGKKDMEKRSGWGHGTSPRFGSRMQLRVGVYARSREHTSLNV